MYHNGELIDRRAERPVDGAQTVVRLEKQQHFPEREREKMT